MAVLLGKNSKEVKSYFLKPERSRRRTDRWSIC